MARNFALNILYSTVPYMRVFLQPSTPCGVSPPLLCQNGATSKLCVNEAALSGEEQGVVLDPRVAVALAASAMSCGKQRRRGSS